MCCVCTFYITLTHVIYLKRHNYQDLTQSMCQSANEQHTHIHARFLSAHLVTVWKLFITNTNIFRFINPDSAANDSDLVITVRANRTRIHIRIRATRLI